MTIETIDRRTLDDDRGDLDALASPSYLRSIEQAREEARAGNTVPLRDLLGD